jgi:FkbM family methyltransferase
MIPVAFVTASTLHGTMIIPARDHNPKKREMGVGIQLLEQGAYDIEMLSLLDAILEHRIEQHGPGAVAIDGGANIGAYTLIMARHLYRRGFVYAFEPQRFIYYALCGNIALNNLFNVDAQPWALGAAEGAAQMPSIDYLKPSNYGGVSLLRDADIGQSPETSYTVKVRTLDSFNFPRVDFIKLDIEGMEPKALIGALGIIKQFHPVIFAEWTICGQPELLTFLYEAKYQVFPLGANLLCCHQDDPIRANFEKIGRKPK